MLAPIVIFAFNRPEALQKLLDSLRMNSFYEESDKYIFIDGPRCEEDKAKVDEVVTIARKVASNISISPVNRGLGNSIIAERIVTEGYNCLIYAFLGHIQS